MKTASIREVRHDFSRILEWVASGEEVAITKRRETVARLIPATRKKTVRVKMPDVAARLQKVFGRKVVSEKVMKQILDDNRGNF
jgi:antitoxin (DNA-binding transcriptional repressor) of toxin-antitoxin stability system